MEDFDCEDFKTLRICSAGGEKGPKWHYLVRSHHTLDIFNDDDIHPGMCSQCGWEKAPVTVPTTAMTGDNCATVSCGATGFDITFESALFNLDGAQQTTFAGGLSATWDGSKWVLNEPLGESGMAHSIDVDSDACLSKYLNNVIN